MKTNNMETDSLFKRRVSQVVKQPDTLRGHTIVWYAKQENTPLKRILLISGLSVFVMAHAITVCILLRNYIDGVSHFTPNPICFSD